MSGRAPAGVAVVLLALMVGCTSEDPPAGLPPSASSTTETPTVTTTPAPTTPAETGAPTVPPVAQQQTPDGAAAFIQHYYVILEYSWSVMDSAPLRALGDCLSCNNLSETIDSVAADGDRLEGGDVTIRSVQPNAVASDGSTTVDTLVSSAEQRIVAPDGTTRQVLGEAQESLQFFFDLGWAGSTWTVTSIRIVE